MLREESPTTTISTVPSTSMSSSVDIRKDDSLPDVETVVSGEHSPKHGHLESKEESSPKKNVDKYGFMHRNMDDEHEKLPTLTVIQTLERRTEKWKTMLSNFSRVRPRLLRKRVRKGIPHEQRGAAWAAICKIPNKIQANSGLYEQLVRDSAFGVTTSGTGQTVSHSKSFQSLQDTIERDIHRTFPRHSLFSETSEEVNCRKEETKESAMGLCGTDLGAMLRDLEGEDGNDGKYSAQFIVEAKGGQASLRRVLKAYSLYDQGVGYCQGMNFITAMFLTIMSEEESFWMLVGTYNCFILSRFVKGQRAGISSSVCFSCCSLVTMQEDPCKMQGLFGEGMHETHMVLHVAEKLLHQFLPKLAQHLENEHIHVTMFATQWLLTQYTSNFHFDLVLRVWDAFLQEGWKITYRVYLAILQHVQPSLLQLSFEEILAYMREIPDRINGDAIVDSAIKIPLRRSHIHKYEREWKLQQQQQQQDKSKQ